MEPDGTIYDAGQVVLRHRGLPGHGWHPAALLRVLADSSVMAAPISPLEYNSGLQRRVGVTAGAARLGERGYPLDQLVRTVFGRGQVGEFTRLSARVAFDISTGRREVPEFLRHLGEALLESTGTAVAADERFAQFLRRLLREPATRRFVRKAAGWVQTADLRHVLTWLFPSATAWSDLPEVDEPEPDPEARWLADRFLLTFVHDWATPSLHLEYRWQRGDLFVGVDSVELTLRTVPDDKLNAAIAARAVTGHGGEYQRSLLSRAIELLEARQFASAVALFEGALAVSPTQWVRNCLAFCLIPLEPTSASQMLSELLDEGFEPPLVLANLAAASRLSGSIDGAHAHAMAGLELLEDEPIRPPAYLWRFGESEVFLGHIDLERYLRDALDWTEASPLSAGDQ